MFFLPTAVQAWLNQAEPNQYDGDIDMWIIDNADVNTSAVQAPAVLIAQANAAVDASGVTRTIGRCSLIRNPATSWATAENASSPLQIVSNYFFLKEKRRLPLLGNVQLLDGPRHGSLSRLADADAEWEFRYLPKADYFGPDQATFLVEMGGQKVKLVYFFNVMDSVPGGTEGYDPYRDKKLCPQGAYWRISSLSDPGSNKHSGIK